MNVWILLVRTVTMVYIIQLVKNQLTFTKIQNTLDYMEIRMKIIKEDITYDMWLQMYKDTNVNKITLEEHTKYARLFAAWKAGNVERVTV